MLLFFALVFTTQKIYAQEPLPDRVLTGTIRKYWVDSAQVSGSTYIWTINDRIVQQGLKSSLVVNWKVVGLYELTVRQISAGGCAGEIQSGQVLVIPGSEIRIFPNPLSGPEVRFQITAPYDTPVTVDLFEPNGQLITRIYEGYFSEGETQSIHYSHQLPQGIYPVQVRTVRQVFNYRILIIRVY